MRVNNIRILGLYIGAFRNAIFKIVSWPQIILPTVVVLNLLFRT